MLSLLPHRRTRIERIEAEAETLIRDFRDEAYSEARRREREASFDALAKHWSRVGLAVAHKTGRRDDLYLTTRMAMNAVPVLDREPAAAREPRRPDGEPKPVAGPRVVLLRRPQLFQIQFLGAAPDGGPTILKKVQIQAADTSAAIVVAANTVWPPRTIGLRILDREGHEVFARQKAARQ
jgi:hypothetical protein